MGNKSKKSGGGGKGGSETSTQDGAPKSNTNSITVPSTSSSTKKHNINILKYDSKAYSNFSKFEKELEEAVGYEFGDLFGFAKTGMYPYQAVPVPRTVETLIEEEKDSVPSTLSVAERAKVLKAIDMRWYGMSDEQKDIIQDGLKEEFKAELRAYSTEKLKKKQDKIKLYWLIRSLMSSESMDAVKQHMLEKWSILEVSQDPLDLWLAIKATHTTYSSGLKEVDEAKARRLYGSLKQYKNETLTSFKDRLEVYIRSMESLGMTVPTQGQLAADYLDKLNDQFENKRSVLFNNARLNGSYP